MPRRGLVAVALLALSGAAATPALAVTDRTEQTPAQIIDQAARDLAKLRGIHFASRAVDADGRGTASGDVYASGEFQLKFAQKGVKVEMRRVGGKTYVDGNGAYWRRASLSASQADMVSGRWVIVSMTAKEVHDLTTGLLPKDLAYCAPRGHGTLSKGRPDTIGGQRVVAILDAGDKPGTSPGRAYVAATGPALPLRAVQTGRRRAGGKRDPRCDAANDTTRFSDTRFAYDKRARIVPPVGAVTLQDAIRPQVA